MIAYLHYFYFLLTVMELFYIFNILLDNRYSNIYYHIPLTVYCGITLCILSIWAFYDYVYYSMEQFSPYASYVYTCLDLNFHFSEVIIRIFSKISYYTSDHVHGKPALDWPRRKRIALGTARGLLYLHEQCDPKIIHRDVKAANILLDEDFEAVVGDFGLAKLLDHQDSHVTTAVRGTVGHIAPEYLSTGQSSEKTDAFGFGILLLELITGQKALDFGRATNQKGVMLDWVGLLPCHRIFLVSRV